MVRIFGLQELVSLALLYATLRALYRISRKIRLVVREMVSKERYIDLFCMLEESRCIY